MTTNAQQTSVKPSFTPKIFRIPKMNLNGIYIDNPVMTREIRSRMRGPRAYLILLAYLGLLSLILFFSYLEWAHRVQGMGGVNQVGKEIFQALFYTQAALIALIIPATTSGTVTIENEQRTFEMLASTILDARQIIIGKIMPAVLFGALLLTSSLPLASITFLMGGVSPSELFSSYLLLVISCFFFASLGVVWSSVSSKTASSVALAIGTVALYSLVTIPASLGSPRAEWFFQAINPVGAVTMALETWPFFKIHMPMWVPAIVINLLVGSLLTTMAARNLPLFHDRPILKMRILWASLFLVLGLCTAANLWGSTYPAGMGTGTGGTISMKDASVTIGVVMLLAFCITLVVLPFFCTDEKHAEDRRRAGTEKKRWGESLTTAPLYLSVLLLLTLGIAITGFPVYKISNLFLGMMENWVAGIVTMVIPVMFFGLMGIYFTKRFSNRWVAVGLTFTLIMMLTVLPFLSAAYDMPTNLSGLHAAQYSFLLSTPLALVQAFGMEKLEPFNQLPIPFFAITSMIYAVLGIVALLLVQKRIAREQK